MSLLVAPGGRERGTRHFKLRSNNLTALAAGSQRGCQLSSASLECIEAQPRQARLQLASPSLARLPWNTARVTSPGKAGLVKAGPIM